MGESGIRWLELSLLSARISIIPFAAAAIYYNDEAGIRAMAGTVAWERRVPILAEPAAAW
jgi:hypothetical protein